MGMDHDRLFKELLQTFFKEFVELFFPEAAEAIDFDHVTFLSEEVFTDLRGGKKGRVDLLVETRLKGEDALILVHLEPQSYHEKDFSERMFLYASRLYEKYRRRIIPIAIFSHKRKNKEPDTFSWEFSFLDVLQFRYFSLQLQHQDWRKFVRIDNPVAAALLSSMGYNKSERIKVYLEFIRMMAHMKLNPAKMELLAVFFEAYLKLNHKEEIILQSEIKRLYPKEEERMMEMITSWEQKGRKEGKLEGKLEGKKETAEEIAAKMLKKGLDPELIIEVTGLSESDIDKLQLSH